LKGSSTVFSSIPYNLSNLSIGGLTFPEKVFHLNKIKPNVKHRTETSIETLKITENGCEDRSICVPIEEKEKIYIHIEPYITSFSIVFLRFRLLLFLNQTLTMKP